jgi:hypothetical protein
VGIIDDYLKSNDSAKPMPEKATGLIEQYLNEGAKPSGRIYVSPAKPPISGVSKEQSDAINSEEGQAGGVNPRSQESYVGRAGSAVYDAAKSGVLTAGQGVGDVLSNKPASGLGEIGSGVLSTLTSPLAAVNQVAGDVTGSSDIANRTGFVAGAALPVVPGANAVSKAVPKNRALSELVDKITSKGREPEKLVETVQAMKANPRIGPADTSPAVLNMAQKLFTTEGDAAKNYLHSTSTNRVKSSADNVNAAYDTAAGLPVNAVNKLKELSDAAKKVGDTQINPAIAGAKPVNITPVIEHIDEILKPGVMSKITGDSTLPFPKVKQALENVKNMIANEKEQLTDPQTLHNFQSALRKEAEARLSSGDGEQRQLGAALMAVRNKLVDTIDEASPQLEGKGSYKPALNNFRSKKEIDEAFHDAYNGVLTNSKKLENRPEFTKEWFDGLTEHEKQAAIEGIRTRIDTEIGVAKNPALAGTSLGKSAFNQKKMEAILGKEETKKLLDTLEAERAISNTHNKIVEGSQTEMRHASDSAVALSKDNPNKSNPLNKYALPAAAGLAEAGSTYLGASGVGSLAVGTLAAGTKLGSMVRAKVVDLLEKERNLQLAKYALPTEGPSRDELIKALEARIPGPKQSMLNRGTNALSRIVAP